MSEVASIPLLGLEERLSQRYRADGLCSRIHNVRPEGVGDRKVWKPIRDTEDLNAPQLLPETASKAVLKIEVDASAMTDGIEYRLGIRIPIDGELISQYVAKNGVDITDGSDLGDPLITKLNGEPLFSDYTFTGYMETTPVDGVYHYHIEVEANNPTLSLDIKNAEFFDRSAGEIRRKDADYINYPFDNVLNYQTALFDIDGGNKQPTGSIEYFYAQLRNFRSEDFTIDPNGFLQRIIAVYSDQIVLLDLDGNDLTQTIPGYEKGSWSTNIQIIRSGEITLIALTNDERGTLLALIDDRFIEIESPVLPKIKLTQSVHSVTSSDPAPEEIDSLKRGNYGLRVGYVLNNGSIIGLSEPYRMGVGYNLAFDDADGEDLVSVKLSVESIPTNLGALTNYIRGIAICITPQRSEVPDAREWTMWSDLGLVGEANYYVAKELKFEEGASTPLNFNEKEIETFPRLSIDTLNANHKIFGTVLYSYNERFIVGGTGYDFVKPRVHQTFINFDHGVAENPVMWGDDPYRIRFVAEIKTDQGTFFRKGPWSEEVIDEKLEYWLQKVSIYYPDSRCTKLHIISDGAFPNRGYVKMKPSTKNNLAYGQINNQQGSNNLEVAEDLSGVDYDKCQIAPNRFNVSELNNPFVYRAKNTHRIGYYDQEKIQAFASNTLPISEGQYGQYPLYVFLDRSIWALEVKGSDDVFFSRKSPVTTRMGLVNYNAIDNVDQSIVFASQLGIYAINGGKLNYVGGPVEETIRNRLDDINLMTIDEGLEREIIIPIQGTGESIVYNTRYNEWYTRDGEPTCALGINNEMYSLRNGTISRHTNTTFMPGKITTHPIDFEAYDYRKKLHNTHVRNSIDMANPATYTLTYDFKGKLVPVYSGSKSEFRTKFGSAFGFIVDIEFSPTSEDEFIEMIQMEYDYKYARKIRN